MLAVFLDRDGVLNRALVKEGKPYPPSSMEELEILEEARLGCALLRDHGFRLICVTNQPDVARGTARIDQVLDFNTYIRDQLGLDAVKICPHDDVDECTCRKPLPGLLLEAAGEFEIDLCRSYMIGDRWRDVDAGQAAGCFTVFVDRDYRERKPDGPNHTTHSTLDAARWIVSHSKNFLENQ
jgi:D-glycero-D-manno-heptose 1,7-bisphosphate phosphatase